MNELTRQLFFNNLNTEQSALLAALSCFDEDEWYQLVRDDGWCAHDIAAHIADVYLTTVALSGVAPRLSRELIGITLPMQPNGRVNTERLNMLRYQANRVLSRDTVLARLVQAIALVTETVNTLDDERLANPGPYGPPETMLEWFNSAVLHSREHRAELDNLQATHPQNTRS
jgi:hypothetical protein